MGDIFAFSPISVTFSVTNFAESPKFSPNLVTFYSTEFPPEFSPKLVTFSSLKFSPFSSIHHNLCQNGENSGENSIPKDFTSKSFWTIPHLKTLGVSIVAFIRIFITGSKSQPTIYKWPWHLMMVIMWNLTMLSSYPPVHYW